MTELRSLLKRGHRKKIVATHDSESLDRQYVNTGESGRRELLIISVANASYTRKRGAGVQNYIHDGSSFHNTPLRQMLQLLSQMGFKMTTYGLRSIYLAKFDRLLNTLFRLMNDRCALLWRSDREDISVPDACHLHDDAFIMIEYLIQVQRSIKDALITERSRTAESRQAYRLLVLTNGPWGSLTHRLKSYVQDVLPKLIIRIENFVQQRITSSSDDLIKDTLKPSMFLAATTRSRSDMMPIRAGRQQAEGTEGDNNKQPVADNIGTLNNRQDDHNRASSSPRDVAVATHSTQTDLVFGQVISKVLEPFIETVRRSCSFPSLVRVLSSGVNAAANSLFHAILKSKLRFSQQGVAVLYNALSSLLDLIAATKASICQSISLSPGNQFMKSFNLIQDTSPWMRANKILMILLSGVPPKNDDGDQLLEARVVVSSSSVGDIAVARVSPGFLGKLFGRRRTGTGRNRGSNNGCQKSEGINNSSARKDNGSVATSGVRRNDKLLLPSQHVTLFLPRFDHDLSLLSSLGAIRQSSVGNNGSQLSLKQLMSLHQQQQLDIHEIHRWLELAAVHPHRRSGASSAACCLPAVAFSRKKNATIGVVLKLDLSRL